MADQGVPSLADLAAPPGEAVVPASGVSLTTGMAETSGGVRPALVIDLEALA